MHSAKFSLFFNIYAFLGLELINDTKLYDLKINRSTTEKCIPFYCHKSKHIS